MYLKIMIELVTIRNSYLSIVHGKHRHSQLQKVRLERSVKL